MLPTPLFSVFMLACSNTLPDDLSQIRRTRKYDNAMGVEDGIVDDPQNQVEAVDSTNFETMEHARIESDSEKELEHKDLDGDGFFDDVDCNDRDSRVHPGATEFCDGIDTDCDGVLDPDTSVDADEWFIDADGDGFGSTEAMMRSCFIPDGLWVTNHTDCDDTDARVHPGAEEMCDGLDFDCDGEEKDGVATWNSESIGSHNVTDEMKSGMFHRLNFGELKICGGTWHTRFEFEISGIVESRSTRVSVEGIGDVVIDGNHEGRLITVGDGVRELELTNLTLHQGAAERGAAIHADELQLELKKVRFSDNTSWGPGGAIHINAGRVEMNEVEFDRNMSNGHGAHGGAIWMNTGDIVGVEALFDGNEASGMANGGAIFLMDGSVTLETTELVDNVASYKGGAIAIHSGDLSLDTSEVFDNRASFGGGIYVGGNVDLRGTKVSSNQADVGAGLYLEDVEGWQFLTCIGGGIDQAGFTLNRAEIRAGAIYIEQGFGSTWQSDGCDWGVGPTDNGPEDIDTPVHSYDAGEDATFSCTNYWCDGLISSVPSPH